MYVADCFRLNDYGTKDYKEVEKQWSAFSNRKTLYDQIRFIDVDGNEIIRVDYKQNGAILVRHSSVLGSGDLTLVSYMSSDSGNGKLFTQSFLLSELMVIKKTYHLYIFTLLISIIISVLVAINKNEKDQIKYFLEYDVMTGVYNGRAGFEKLSQLYKNIGKENCIISICFIDINGLKEVNDALGHEAGDELILSVSHGIEVFRCESNQIIDEIVNHADEKMYNEKREIKKDLKVLRDIKNI